MPEGSEVRHFGKMNAIFCGHLLQNLIIHHLVINPKVKILTHILYSHHHINVVLFAVKERRICITHILFSNVFDLILSIFVASG